MVKVPQPEVIKASTYIAQTAANTVNKVTNKIPSIYTPPFAPTGSIVTPVDNIGKILNIFG